MSSPASNVVISGAEGSDMLSSMLAAASPEQQKQILGERLYPLVSEHQVDIFPFLTSFVNSRRVQFREF